MSKLPIIISVISLVISLIQFTISIYSRRFTIKISPICFEKSKSELYRKFFFQVLIENKSNLPISITNIKAISSNGSLVNCSLTKHFVGESFRTIDGKEVNKTTYYSTEFPINISSYGAVMPYIVFKLSKDDETNIFADTKNSLRLEVYTNRKMKTVHIKNFKEITFFDL